MSNNMQLYETVLNNKARVLKKAVENYMCPICHDVCWDIPVFHAIKECGNTFCGKCILQWRKHAGCCPCCRQPLANFKTVPKMVLNALDGLEVECIQCKLKMHKSKFQKHYQNDCPAQGENKCSTEQDCPPAQEYIQCLCRTKVLKLKKDQHSCYVTQFEANQLFEQTRAEEIRRGLYCLWAKVDVRIDGFWWQARIVDVNAIGINCFTIRVLHFSNLLTYCGLNSRDLAPFGTKSVGPREVQRKENLRLANNGVRGEARWNSYDGRWIEPAVPSYLTEEYKGTLDEYESYTEKALTDPSPWIPESGAIIEFNKGQSIVDNMDQNVWRRAEFTERSADGICFGMYNDHYVFSGSVAKLGTNTNENGNNKWRVGDEIELKNGRTLDRVIIEARIGHETWKIHKVLDPSRRAIVHELFLKPIMNVPRSLAIDYTLPENLQPVGDLRKEWKIGDIVDAKDISNNDWWLARIEGKSNHTNEYTVHVFGFATAMIVNGLNIVEAGLVTKLLNRKELEHRKKINNSAMVID